jgi:ubiquinone/menaquinone biosynthesis C-methylase UbiE
VENARYNKEGKRLNNEFSFNLPGKSADVIYLYSVFSHMTQEDMCVYLKEFYRILDANGKIFLTTFVEEIVPAFSVNPQGYKFNQNSGQLHVVRYEKAHLFALVAGIGFSIDKFSYSTETDGQSALYLSKR